MIYDVRSRYFQRFLVKNKPSKSLSKDANALLSHLLQTMQTQQNTAAITPTSA